MGFFLSTALSYVLLYKYPALFAIAYLSSLILPLPSDTALLAAGAFASQGYLNIYIILFIVILGSVLGDFSGFWIARRYGKEFLMKIGLRKMLASKKFINLEKFITNNSGFTIFITRFIGQAGPLVNILVGLSEMSFKRFLLYEFTGTVADVLLLGLAGYFLGSAWQNFTSVIEFVGIGLVILVIVFIWSRVYFRSLKS